MKQLKKSKRAALSAILHVSGDGLRVVDKKSSGMLVDQVIEKEGLYFIIIIIIFFNDQREFKKILLFYF